MKNVLAILSPTLTSEEQELAVSEIRKLHPEEAIAFRGTGESPSSMESDWESYNELSEALDGLEDIQRVIFFGRDPRFFTAQRSVVPGSEPLNSVPFEVAQELIGFFSDVLTPAFIHRVDALGAHLQLSGFRGTTTVEPPREATPPIVRSIGAKRGVVLLSISTTNMWRQTGFLAKVFTLCAQLGLSVDQVSASESEVTLTLDGDSHAISADRVNELTQKLSEMGSVRLEEPCAAVTVVGQRIRSILTQLSPVLDRFEEERVFLISQSASGSNLTFVVEESKANKLVRDLHSLLFPEASAPKSQEKPILSEAHWWIEEREALLKMSRHQQTPFFLLHQPTVERQLDVLMSTSGCERFLFAMKSNHHPDLLRIVRKRGVRFECVSPEEIDHLFRLFPDMTGEEILYTPNFASAEDFRRGFERGTYVTLDNHSPLEDHPNLFEGKSLVLRLDPGRGEGHHKHVKTAGRSSKFGIDLEMLVKTKERLAELGCTVIGLHCHAGSGIRSVRPWARNAKVLASQLHLFPKAKFLDLGGGFGIPERPGEVALDLSQLKIDLAPIREAHPGLEIWLEPGRFIVAQAGVLLTRVNQVKQKGEQNFVGVDAGMNSLIRPALYGAYHPLVNLSRLHDQATLLADVVGPICESGDVLGSQRLLPQSRVGDLFLVANTGAYGKVMSSRYNMREPAPELWWRGSAEA